MTRSINARIIGGFAILLLVLPVAVAQAAAPQSSGVYLELESDGGGQTQMIQLSLAPDRMRFDTDAGISMVTIGGEDSKMLMIQHAQQQYMEFTAEMMEAMAGMMGQAPPEMEEQAGDMTPPTFTRTGNTKMVGSWNAYEVLVEHPEQEGEMAMWFTQDLDVDFRTIAEQLANSMSSLLNNPMAQMGGRGGGGGMSDMFAEFQAQMASMDMPDGFPVQIVSDAGGGQTTTTLRAIDENASFGPETWEAPAGYTKMEMPFIRR